MTDTYSLNSSNYDSHLLELIGTVQGAADQNNLSIFLLGATARDIVMTTFFGASQQRATLDVDFGICVSDWDSFHKLKTSLVDQGFTEGKEVHRLVSPNKILVDIVPYGELSKQGIIKWPPKGDEQMSVLGFSEANSAALEINLSESNQIIRVASPDGIALLKMISWSERNETLRLKDAVDIGFLASNYSRLPKVESRSFEEEIAERFGYEIPVACAYILGIDVIALASTESMVVIKRILERSHKESGIEKFIEEAIPKTLTNKLQKDNLIKVLNAFELGLRESLSEV